MCAPIPCSFEFLLQKIPCSCPWCVTLSAWQGLEPLGRHISGLPMRNFLDWVNWSMKTHLKKRWHHSTDCMERRKCSGLHTKQKGNQPSTSISLFWLLTVAAISHVASLTPLPQHAALCLKLWAKANLSFLKSTTKASNKLSFAHFSFAEARVGPSFS